MELMELIQKGEVAWLNAADAPKEKDVSSARRGGRPAAAWRNDDYDDEPSTSRGQGAPICSVLDKASSMILTLRPVCPNSGSR